MTQEQLVIAEARCEYLSDPLAIDDARPRFSWRLEGSGFDRGQSAYRIVVRREDEVVWDSGRVAGSETLQQEYAGEPLRPLSDYRWTVEAWDEAGQPARAAAGSFGTGLLGAKWDAAWICVPPSRGARPPEATLMYRNPFRALNVSYFRREFSLGAVKSARLYATALGTYRFFLNGERVGADYLTPSFTDYHQRLDYQTHDVTGLLREGENAIAAQLGEGWYSGYLGLDAKQPAAIWGRKPQLSAFLLVTLESGETVRLETDRSWRHALGGLIYSDMLKGEKFDARLEPDGWFLPGYDDARWAEPGIDAGASGQIHASKAPAVRATRQLTPVSVVQAPDGSWVFDLGQNMVGFCTARFRARRDQMVRLVHAEMLNPDGTLYLDNLRTANQEDIYVAAADGEVSYTPSFTFHGFRYVAIHGLAQAPGEDAIAGIVINNDLAETSRFECSDPVLNQLQQNILWSQRGNFISVPTDCPQRDERLGWTADGQVFAPTAAYNMDIAAFFTKWMDDIVDSQSAEGAFGDVAPRVTQTADGAPAWGDAGVILPLLLFERYGDRRVVERCYESMARWIEYIRRANPDYIRRHRNNNNYGDWLAIGQQTPNELVATAYYAWLAKLMAKAAALLGVVEDVAYYEALHRAIATAFRSEYVAVDGTVGNGSQTSYLIALFAGLVPEELVAAAVGKLVANIHANGDHLAIGFLGVRHICPVLSAHGEHELAVKLATSTEFPSWGYSIANGATTIWERWDGWTREGGFQVPNMNSFNHYAYGSVGEWLFEWLGGIAPDPEHPGWRHFLVRPTPTSRLSYCTVEYSSVRGSIASRWEGRGASTAYRFSIPAGTSATLELVAGHGDIITLGGEARQPNGWTRKYGDLRAVLEVGSGDHVVTVAGAAARRREDLSLPA